MICPFSMKKDERSGHTEKPTLKWHESIPSDYLPQRRLQDQRTQKILPQQQHQQFHNASECIAVATALLNLKCLRPLAALAPKCMTTALEQPVYFPRGLSRANSPESYGHSSSINDSSNSSSSCEMPTQCLKNAPMNRQPFLKRVNTASIHGYNNPKRARV